jgi:hypothetical protein
MDCFKCSTAKKGRAVFSSKMMNPSATWVFAVKERVMLSAFVNEILAFMVGRGSDDAMLGLAILVDLVKVYGLLDPPSFLRCAQIRSRPSLHRGRRILGRLLEVG